MPVYIGGPVGRAQLMFAAFEWRKGEGLKLNHDIKPDEAPAVEVDRPLVCAFVLRRLDSGGQLESEMKQNAWLLQKPHSFSFQPEKLPETLVRHHARTRAMIQNALGSAGRPFVELAERPR